jgi:hypothetical protein
VRSTSLLHAKVQYLLLGCVELLPREIPAPQRALMANEKFGDYRIVTNAKVCDVSEGLAWYENAIAGNLVVPGSHVKLATVALAPEPSLGRLAGN